MNLCSRCFATWINRRKLPKWGRKRKKKNSKRERGEIADRYGNPRAAAVVVIIRIRDRDDRPLLFLLRPRGRAAAAAAAAGDGGAAAEAAGEEEGVVEGGYRGQRVPWPQELQEVLHLPQGGALRRGLQRRRRRGPESAGRRRGRLFLFLPWAWPQPQRPPPLRSGSIR